MKLEHEGGGKEGAGPLFGVLCLGNADKVCRYFYFYFIYHVSGQRY